MLTTVYFPSSFSIKEAAELLIQDLDRYLRIRSSVQTRKIKCLALVRTSKIDKLKAKSEYRDPNDPTDPDAKMVRSQPISSLVRQLNRVFLSRSLILDETAYLNKVDIDIDLNKKYNNLSELRSTLKKYDLDLVEVERDLPMLVLKDVRK